MPPKGSKGGRRPGAGRKPLWRNKEEQKVARGVYIGAQNVRKWILLKESLGYVNDPEFATFLLTLAELQPAGKTQNVESSEIKAEENSAVLIVTGVGEATEKTNLRESNDQVKEMVVGNSEENQPEEEEEILSESFREDDKDADWRPPGCRELPSGIRRSPRAAAVKARESHHQRRTRSQTKVVQVPLHLHRKGSAIEDYRKAPSNGVVATVETLADGSPKQLSFKSRMCLDCNQKHSNEGCSLLNPVITVCDNVPIVTNSENSVENITTAERSLPPMLQLVMVDKMHGLSVFTNEKILKCTQFGPLIGRKISESTIPEEMDMKNLWEVFCVNGKCYLDTTDPNESNWLRYVRPAPLKEDRNVSAISKEDCLYFVTVKDVEAGAELLYWTDNPAIFWSKKKMEKSCCGGCNQKFAHPLYYRMHCRICHDPNYSLTIRKYHCKVCGAAVLGKENIMRHAAEMHDGKGAYQCPHCKKFFLRLHSLDTHVRYSCKLNPKKVRPLCDHCGKKFCQPQHLKAHVKRMHTEISEVLKEFQCKSCFKLLGSRAALQRHLKEVHNKEQNIAATCDRCGKTFQNKSNLKIHMLTHSGVKPFRCTENTCNAAFTTKQCLQFHYRKVHGYSVLNMPSIERCVAYTFESYAGSVSEPSEGHGHSEKSCDFESGVSECGDTVPQLQMNVSADKPGVKKETAEGENDNILMSSEKAATLCEVTSDEDDDEEEEEEDDDDDDDDDKDDDEDDIDDEEDEDCDDEYEDEDEDEEEPVAAISRQNDDNEVPESMDTRDMEVVTGKVISGDVVERKDNDDAVPNMKENTYAASKCQECFVPNGNGGGGSCNNDDNSCVKMEESQKDVSPQPQHRIPLPPITVPAVGTATNSKEVFQQHQQQQHKVDNFPGVTSLPVDCSLDLRRKALLRRNDSSGSSSPMVSSPADNDEESSRDLDSPVAFATANYQTEGVVRYRANHPQQQHASPPSPTVVPDDACPQRMEHQSEHGHDLEHTLDLTQRLASMDEDDVDVDVDVSTMHGYVDVVRSRSKMVEFPSMHKQVGNCHSLVLARERLVGSYGNSMAGHGMDDHVDSPGVGGGGGGGGGGSGSQSSMMNMHEEQQHHNSRIPPPPEHMSLEMSPHSLDLSLPRSSSGPSPVQFMGLPLSRTSSAASQRMEQLLAARASPHPAYHLSQCPAPQVMEHLARPPSRMIHPHPVDTMSGPSPSHPPPAASPYSIDNLNLTGRPSSAHGGVVDHQAPLPPLRGSYGMVSYQPGSYGIEYLTRAPPSHPHGLPLGLDVHSHHPPPTPSRGMDPQMSPVSQGYQDYSPPVSVSASPSPAPHLVAQMTPPSPAPTPAHSHPGYHSYQDYY